MDYVSRAAIDLLAAVGALASVAAAAVHGDLFGAFAVVAGCAAGGAAWLSGDSKKSQVYLWSQQPSVSRSKKQIFDWPIAS
jgi:hypothetical protein